MGICKPKICSPVYNHSQLTIFKWVFWCSCPCFEVQQSFPVRLSTGSTVQAQVSQHPLLCHCFWSLLLQLFFPTFCYQLSLIDYYTYVRALLVLSQGSYTCNSLLTSSHQMQPYVNVLIYAKIAAEHHSSVASAEKHLKHGFAGGHLSSVVNYQRTLFSVLP